MVQKPVTKGEGRRLTSFTTADKVDHQTIRQIELEKALKDSQAPPQSLEIVCMMVKVALVRKDIEGEPFDAVKEAVMSIGGSVEFVAYVAPSEST